MAQPLDPMALYQGYQTADSQNALRSQTMNHAAQMHPMKIRQIQENMLAKRAEIERNLMRDAHQAQYQNNALQSRERMANERLNALALRPGRPMREQIIQTEQGPMRMVNGVATPVLGPDGQPVRGKSTERALPVSASKGLLENQENLRRAEQAAALLEGKDITDAAGNVVMQGDREATGKKGLLSNLGVIGDKTLNWLDPKGVDARAAVGDLGSLIIHDRSGAAVTAAEFPRLRPFIPLSSDSPEVARKKVQRFKTEYQNIQQEMTDFYKESGYKVPTGALRGGAGAPQAGWDDAKESRYQELLRKRNGS